MCDNIIVAEHAHYCVKCPYRNEGCSHSVFTFESFWTELQFLYRIHYIVKEKMTWNDAHKYCRDNYYDRSTINKEAEMHGGLQPSFGASE